MSLQTTSVSRCLDKKFKVLGYEVADLLVILLTFGTLKVIFTGTGLETYFVWLPSLTGAVAIRIMKRGKPDDYLRHLGRFYFRPRFWSAFPSPSKWETPPHLNKSHQSVENSL